MAEDLFSELSIQEDISPYKLDMKETFYSIFVILTVALLYAFAIIIIFDVHSQVSIFLSSFTLLKAIAVVIGLFLIITFFKAYEYFIELKSLKDIYETLRWGELKDISLDNLFNAIRLIKFKGLSELFYSGPKNAALISAVNACESKQESISFDIDGINVEELSIHSIYKAASKRELCFMTVLTKQDNYYECEANICIRFKYIHSEDDNTLS